MIGALDGTNNRPRVNLGTHLIKKPLGLVSPWYLAQLTAFSPSQRGQRASLQMDEPIGEQPNPGIGTRTAFVQTFASKPNEKKK